MPNPLPTRNTGSLGPTKSYNLTVQSEGTQLRAAEYNVFADGIVEIAAEIGNTASPANGSILKRLDDLEDSLADLAALLPLADLIAISGSVGDETIALTASLQIEHALILDEASVLIDSSQNNYAIPTGSAGRSVLRIDMSAGAISITGFIAAESGFVLHVLNVSSVNLTLPHQSGSSTDVNRFICPNASNLVLGAGENCTMIYDGATQRWRVVGQST